MKPISSLTVAERAVLCVAITKYNRSYKDNHSRDYAGYLTSLINDRVNWFDIDEIEYIKRALNYMFLETSRTTPTEKVLGSACFSIVTKLFEV